MPWNQYFGLLRTDGTLVAVGAPEEEIKFNLFSLFPGRRKLASSKIGSPDEIREMLQLAADKNIQPWIEKRPMKEANQAMLDLDAGKPRFRYVLVN